MRPNAPNGPRPPRSDFSRTDWRRGRLRIAVVVGTSSRDELQEYHLLLDKLYDTPGYRALLDAVKGNGELLGRVMATYKREKLFGLLAFTDEMKLQQPLFTAMHTSADRLGTSKATRNRYRHSAWKYERLSGLGRAARVQDLLAFDFVDLRTRWIVRRPGGTEDLRASASDWNHLGRFLSTFLTDFFGGGRTGRSNPFRQRVLDRFPREPEQEREVTLTVAEFGEIVRRLPQSKQAPIVTIAVTGLRLGEYLALTPASLEGTSFTIRVRGKSGPGVVQVQAEVWPVIEAAVPPPVRSPHGLRDAFRRAAAAAGHPDLRIHDLRHLNATALLWAGANIGEVRDGLRHADATTTMRYVKGANRARAANAAAAAFAPVLKLVGNDQ